MSSIPQDDVLCQEEEIPFETGPITRLPTPEPDTPLADFLAISDPAGMDAEVMDFTIWLETWEHEPDWNFFEDEVTA